MGPNPFFLMIFHSHSDSSAASFHSVIGCTDAAVWRRRRRRVTAVVEGEWESARDCVWERLAVEKVVEAALRADFVLSVGLGVCFGVGLGLRWAGVAGRDVNVGAGARLAGEARGAIIGGVACGYGQPG
jgi:hypothetical protein